MKIRYHKYKILVFNKEAKILIAQQLITRSHPTNILLKKNNYIEFVSFKIITTFATPKNRVILKIKKN